MPTLKFKYNESMKRVSIDNSEVSFSVFVLKVKESFAALSTVDNRTLSFLWQDGDGDKCTCETDRENLRNSGCYTRVGKIEQTANI